MTNKPTARSRTDAKLALIGLATLSLIPLGSGTHAGNANPGEVAAGIPVTVVEVGGGGSWIEGAASGAYRTVSIQGGGDNDAIEVFVQWVGAKTPTQPTRIIASLPLLEFNEQRYGSASVTLEGAVENAARITIAVPDGDQRAIKPIAFIAAEPGHYRLLAPNAINGMGLRN